MNGRAEAFLSYGFRPFFLLGSIYAIISIARWIIQFLPESLALGGIWPTPTPAWHGHEMLFGYTWAVIAGFFLTAVPAWTNRKPVAGYPLLGLVLVWVAGRLVNWLTASHAPLLTAIVDCAFIPVLVVLIIRSLIAGWSTRNLIFLPVFAGFFTANVMVHLERLGIASDTEQSGHRLALDLTVALIIIIGGRIVPAFTTSYLRDRNVTELPHQSDLLTRLSRLSVVAMVLGNQLWPGSYQSGVTMGLAAVITAMRLSGWRFTRVLGEPVLWILFMGYGFIVLGLIAGAVSVFTHDFPRTLADHLLTIGGIGCMTLGVMTRASLGHTGRTLCASRGMITAFVLIAMASLVRTAGPVLWPAYYAQIMVVAGGVWILAFSIFTTLFWPVLTRARLQK